MIRTPSTGGRFRSCRQQGRTSAGVNHMASRAAHAVSAARDRGADDPRPFARALADPSHVALSELPPPGFTSGTLNDGS